MVLLSFWNTPAFHPLQESASLEVRPPGPFDRNPILSLSTIQRALQSLARFSFKKDSHVPWSLLEIPASLVSPWRVLIPLHHEKVLALQHPGIWGFPWILALWGRSTDTRTWLESQWYAGEIFDLFQWAVPLGNFKLIFNTWYLLSSFLGIRTFLESIFDVDKFAS